LTENEQTAILLVVVCCLKICRAEVAQLVEHLTENQRVPSSSLGLGIPYKLKILGDRLMVGQRPLEPYIQVRILVSQCNSLLLGNGPLTWGRSVAVNTSACQAEDRGFNSRRSRSKQNFALHYRVYPHPVAVAQ
jgi:hypothetical protein